ncbi:MAG: DUF2807 domain-containing protein [bacterium]|nr:DUF2807 domain-containing protein [bacterium]
MNAFNNTISSRIYTLFKNLTKPKPVEGIFANLVLAFPRILAGLFLATMFGGDKFGVPWSLNNTELGLFEVATWFPEDVAKFGAPFSWAPLFFAWMGAASEAIGGMFLLWGFQTRISGFLIAFTMLVAVFFQKWGGGLWGMLPALGFLWVGLYAMAFGSGKIGLDYLLSRWLTKRDTQIEQKLNELKTERKLQAGKLVVLVVMLVFTTSVQAQIKGNGEWTQNITELPPFERIENGLSSEISIVVGDKSEMTISNDQNLIEYIQMEVIEGTLIIDQKEWISPSQRISISLQTPILKSFTNSAHGTFTIKDVSAKTFVLNPAVGNVVLDGKAEELIVNTNVAKIDATKLVAINANITIESFGEVRLDKVEKLTAEVSSTGKIVFNNQPDQIISTIENGGKLVSAEDESMPSQPVVYIDLALKNNSKKRVNVIFEGPENARFGYGAPFRRNQSRSERFPVGTKVYQQLDDESKKLLLIINEADSNKTIDLFQ